MLTRWSLYMKFLKIDSSSQIDERLATLRRELQSFNWNHSVQITWDKYQPVRSLNQSALAEVWYRTIAKWCNDHGMGLTDPDTGEVSDFTQEDAKGMMKLYFIGSKTKHLGSKEIHIPPSTSTLSKGEFFNYMEKMLAWATDKGIALPLPEDSQFVKLRNGE
jgi:hypothetical protein